MLNNVSEIASNFVHNSVGVLGSLTTVHADLDSAKDLAEAVAGDEQLVSQLRDGIQEAMRMGYPVRDAYLVLKHLDMCHREMVRRAQVNVAPSAAFLLH